MTLTLRTFGPMFLATLPLAFGCQAVESAPEELDQALSTDYGDLDPSDEAPDFGDPEFAAIDLAGADVDAADPEDPIVTELEADPVNPPRHLRVLLAWGHLRPRPDATVATDWSGRISVTNAGLRVLRTVAFEPGDELVRPREDLHYVDFASHTLPHADGVLLDVVLHPTLNPAGEPIVLTFASGPITQELTLAPGLPRMDAVAVDDDGNALAYAIFAPDADASCQQGYLAGRWTQVGDIDGRPVGRLRGRWLSADGELHGKLRGVWGQRANGSRVFFAKVIGADGAWKGILAGRYALGRFGGIYLGDRDHTIDGVVRGRYFDGPADDGAGFFAGRWALRCGELPTEGTPADSDEVDIGLDE